MNVSVYTRDTGAEGMRTPVFIDIEASGFGSGSYPIEVGVVLEDGLSWEALIRPVEEWRHWDPKAAALHRLDRASLRDRGLHVAQVARRLNELLAGKTVYSDAWGNDMAWIALLFEKADLYQNFRIESLASLLTEPWQRDWHGTKQQVLKSLGRTPHRAAVDARVLRETYLRLQTKHVVFDTRALTYPLHSTKRPGLMAKPSRG
ncbi:MAG: hypothetical protein KDH88_02925 [Chromatiales bacterium]|nr:hypothetical protein [Chromatiales bacterium]